MIAGVLCGAAAQREVAVVEMASGGDGRRRRRMATATDGVEAAASKAWTQGLFPALK